MNRHKRIAPSRPPPLFTTAVNTLPRPARPRNAPLLPAQRSGRFPHNPGGTLSKPHSTASVLAKRTFHTHAARGRMPIASRQLYPFLGHTTPGPPHLPKNQDLPRHLFYPIENWAQQAAPNSRQFFVLTSKDMAANSTETTVIPPTSSPDPRVRKPVGNWPSPHRDKRHHPAQKHPPRASPATTALENMICRQWSHPLHLEFSRQGSASVAP